MSLFFGNRLNHFKMDEAGDKGGGGGGTGGQGGGTDPAKEIADLKAGNAALLARLDALEKAGKKEEPPADPTLADKARKAAEDKDKAAANEKGMEAALRFTMGSKDWAKANEGLLPKTIIGIFEQADKENYASAVEKANAIKVDVIGEFFKVQANLDLLSPGQKTALEDFLKLTKNGKQEEAHRVYDMVFEPALEMLKKVKKAEHLSLGHSPQSDAEQAYKDKLIKGARKHYLGEKQNA